MAKHLERGEEVDKDGERFYKMADMDHPKRRPRLYKADVLDGLAAFSRVEIRKDKYSIRGVQKTHRKRGR